MSDGPTALYTAIYTALTADPPIGAAVHDVVPQNAPFPQIEIPGGTLQSGNAAVLQADTHAVEIHVWSRNTFAEARTLMNAVKSRLDLANLDLGTGAELTFIKFTSSDLMVDADGVTRHGIVRFKAMVTT